jgi:hypothetical protein
VRLGESETLEFAFFGHANRVFRARAECEVQGGPTYEIALSGGASVLQYRFDRKALDFGLQLFHQTADKDIVLYNTGRVPLPFEVSLATVKRAGVLAVAPMNGTLLFVYLSVSLSVGLFGVF